MWRHSIALTIAGPLGVAWACGGAAPPPTIPAERGIPPAPPPSAAPGASAPVSKRDEDAGVPDSPVDVDPARAGLQQYYAESSSPPWKGSVSHSPESLSRRMEGAIACGKESCRAGLEVCVRSPSYYGMDRCEAIASWLNHRTPRPGKGFPAGGDVIACDGSHNCPAGTVCCLHDLQFADVVVFVCQANQRECRDGKEVCNMDVPNDCRTPGTHCDSLFCRP